MVFDPAQVEELKRCYPNLSSVSEGGTDFVRIPSLPLPKGCNPAVIDALLCPSVRDGYASRLFLSAKVSHSGPGQNWNASGVQIAGSKWWAVSWNTNQPNLRLLGMVINHIQAFQCK